MARTEQASRPEPASPEKPVLMTVPVTLTAVIRAESVGGYSASIPALLGCVTEGETLDEVQANLREAAEGWLGAMHDRETERAARGEAP